MRDFFASSVHWGALFAALTIIMVPTLIMYITFQKQIQDGITTGALKG